MAGGRSSRWKLQRVATCGLSLLLVQLLLASTVQAFEAFEGRLQAHGFFASQLRALNSDYSEDWDVAQWYMVFNLELEMDLIQDTVGPIDLLSAYVRAEVRYDCIYSSGCGMFRSMNAYGDRSKSLPRRLVDFDRVRHSGRIRVPNDPEVPDQFRNYSSFREKVPGTLDDAPVNRFVPGGTNTDPLTAIVDPVLALFAGGDGGDGIGPRDVCQGPVCDYLAGGGAATTTGPSPVMPPALVRGTNLSQVWPNSDSPYDDLARAGRYGDFVFIVPGAAGFGPWLPKNFFQSVFTHTTAANPFDDRVGSYALQASVYNAYLLDVNDLTPLFDADDDPLDSSGASDPSGSYLNQVVNAATNGEDVNGNGTLDPGEDLNANGILDNGGQAAVGAGELPYRPAPLFREDGAGVLQARNAGDPRGLFVPSKPLADRLNKGNLSAIESDYNFNESERQWNRGASQKDEKELKEAYFDLETFDNRLWLRIGKQQIVWGKTELFRTTDQFNPTDLALGSLTSLEESRIALWSARGVWSFYEVGPIDDVRLELAFIFDDYQQADIGACGEAYAPNVTCQLTFGAFANGAFGVGLAGVEEPPDPWQSLQGWEVGARLEWRYDRFSFALMDFYGYDDFPVIEKIATYTRNVDPYTGRPREIFGNLDTLVPNADPYFNVATHGIEQLGTQGTCVTGREEACLLPKADIDGDGIISTANVFEDTNRNGVLDPGEDVDGDMFLDLGSELEGLTHSAVAQQLYAYTCATSVGFSALDRAACSLNVLGSKEDVIPGVASVAQAIGALLAGSPFVNGSQQDTYGGLLFPLVNLNVGPRDLDNANTNGSTTPCLDNGTSCGGQGSGLIGFLGTVTGTGRLIFSETLGGVLSPEQEALLGCGPFWGTQCDDTGIDLLTAEGSALFQSWPGVEGTVQNGDITTLWLTNQKVTSATTGGEVFAQQPGTRGWYFDSTRRHDLGAVCTTADFGGAIYKDSSDGLENDRANGNQAVLPGCHRKWKRDPDDSAFAGSQQILALNLYGQDLACARERAANGGTASSDDCTGAPTGGYPGIPLGDFDSERVDPRSWQADRDGEPDFLAMQYIDFGPGVLNIGARATYLPPARDIGGTLTVAPDYFYGRPFGLQVFGPNSTNPAGSQAGLAFDNCDATGYSAAIIAEYGGADFVPCGKGGHPMTGQPWASEMAAVSWNFMVTLIQQDLTGTYDAAALAACGAVPDPVTQAYRECAYPVARDVFLPSDIDERNSQCSLLNPALCATWRTLQGAIGLQRNVRRAGGNGTHGRRTFAWQSGGQAIITYNKRNVLGFSMDFAEDVTKSNFSFEFTWIEGVVVANNNQYDGLDEADDLNLTMSVDRPTFINFLNSNRTFFFNWQFFARYRVGWEKGYTDEGAWNFLTTFAVATGYFQDRLSPSITTVYDIQTQSGALLTGVSYRFTQNFSAAVGMAFFYGKTDHTDEPLSGIGPAGNRTRSDRDHLYDSNRSGGLAVVGDRDELWARIRYTF